MTTTRIAVLLVLITAISASAQTLSDADIAAAITLGESDPKEYTAISSSSHFSVYIVGRLGRIAAVAWNQKRTYKPLALEQLGEGVTSDEIFVRVTPQSPGTSRERRRNPHILQHVVLRLKDSGEIIQPLALDWRPETWGNALGAKVTLPGAAVRFRALPLSDFDVVLATSRGDDVHKFHGDKRARIK